MTGYIDDSTKGLSISSAAAQCGTLASLIEDYIGGKEISPSARQLAVGGLEMAAKMYVGTLLTEPPKEILKALRDSNYEQEEFLPTSETIDFAYKSREVLAIIERRDIDENELLERAQQYARGLEKITSGKSKDQLSPDEKGYLESFVRFLTVLREQVYIAELIEIRGF